MLENMLDYIRITLYMVLIFLGFLLYQAWEKEHPSAMVSKNLATETLPTNRYVPSAVAQAESTNINTSEVTKAPQIAAPLKGQLVTVTTDVLQVNIDTRGGDIIETKLLNYPESLHSKIPFLFLNDDPKTRYLAESGLLSKTGPDTSETQGLYTTSQAQYNLAPGENKLAVSLYWQNADGLKVTKTFHFTRDSYEIKVSYEVDNQSQVPWQGNLYTQLLRTDSPPPTQGGMVNLTTYFGGAISTAKKPFEKISFKEMQEKDLSLANQNGWVAMVQHYFIGAWIPPRDQNFTYYSRVNHGLYTLGMIGDRISAEPGKQVATEAKLYVGPAIANQLEKAAPNLKLTIDYGWFWFISDIIFWMMQKIYDVVGNWGWSIVFVTIIIKLLFYHLSSKSYRSMSGMKKLQPKIEQLKQRFGDDKQKFTQATMDLYRQEKVNPMSGCLPILIQIPVFIALYWVLVESVQLRQAPFIFWIQDLSQHDPYYILPLLMGVSMFLQQRLNPPPPDPLQAKVMMLMPIIFTVLFVNFPAGLMLYWFVNNTLSFLQQWYIMHKIDKEAGVKK